MREEAASGAANGGTMEGSVYSEGRPTPVGNGAAAFVTDSQSRTVLGWAGSGSLSLGSWEALSSKLIGVPIW